MLIRYSLHDLAFAIEADEPIARDIADAVMPACRAGRQRGNAAGTFRVRNEGGRFQVFLRDRLLWHAGSRSELLPWLEAEVVAWLLKGFRRYVQVHAAVVQRRGRALVLAGASDAGKTSLACAMGMAGWGVMSDEVALVEPRSSAVASFPRAMLVKTGTVRRLPELRAMKARRVQLDSGLRIVRYVNPETIGGPVRERATVSAVAFPGRSANRRIEPLGETEAVERLLGLTFNTGGRRKTAVDTCVRLVRGSRLWFVGGCDLRENARMLAEVFG